MRNKALIINAVMVLVMVSAGAFAQTDITSAITNPSFETDIPDGTEASVAWIIPAVPTGWGGGPSVHVYDGVANLTEMYGGDYGPATDGLNGLSTPFYGTGDGRYEDGINGEVYQTTSHVILPTSVYTATADLMAFTGGASDNDLGRMTLYYLVAGGDDSVPADRVMISESLTLMVATNGGTNTPAAASVTFDSAIDTAGIGRPLGIVLDGHQEDAAVNDTAWAIWDNVQLSVLTTGPVAPDPNITGSPAFAIVDQDYTLTAPGDAPFQWYVDDVLMGTETSSTLSFTPLLAGDAGKTYHVTYEDGLSKFIVTSNDFLLSALPSGTTLPVTGLLGLGLLAGACAMGGARLLRRKK